MLLAYIFIALQIIRLGRDHPDALNIHSERVFHFHLVSQSMRTAKANQVKEEEGKLWI